MAKLNVSMPAFLCYLSPLAVSFFFVVRKVVIFEYARLGLELSPVLIPPLYGAKLVPFPFFFSYKNARKIRKVSAKKESPFLFHYLLSFCFFCFLLGSLAPTVKSCRKLSCCAWVGLLAPKLHLEVRLCMGSQ